MNSLEAKNFIASRIVTQAALEGVSFSEVERKMLFFSETHPSLPDMDQVLVEFEESFNMFPYERVVSTLICNSYRIDRRQPTLAKQWRDARTSLRREDHYINVMLKRGLAAANRKRDFLIYVAIGFVVVLLSLAVIVWGR
jgi:hypothetical protein